MNVKKQVNKFLCITMIVLLLFTSGEECFADSTEYSAGSATWYRGNLSVTLNILYTPSVDSVFIRVGKDTYGFRGKYYLDQPGGYVTHEIYNNTMGSNITSVGTFNGLQPNTPYKFAISVECISTVQGSYWLNNYIFGDFTVYTDAVIPYSITFPTIGVDSIKVRWINDNNPADTSYTLQRSTDGNNWVNVITQTGMSEHMLSGLTQDTTYYFRVRVNEKSGRYKYSEVRTIKTTADPTVAAALAAQSAAEAANAASQETKALAASSKTAAETARIYAEEAKTAANSANTNASNAYTAANNAYNVANNNYNALYNGTYGLEPIYNKINNTDTKIDNIETQINNMQANIAPTINSIKGLGGATCTTNSNFTVVIGASGASEYRAKVDNGSYTSWGASDSINLTGITEGAHIITVEARNAGGKTAKKLFSMFRI